MRFFTVILFFLSLDLKAVCSFQFIDNELPPQALKSKINRTLKELQTSKTEIAQYTYESICAGRAQIGTLADVTYLDFLQILSDFKRYGTESFLTAAHYQNLKKKNSKSLIELKRHLDGYMWEKRIYLSDNNDSKTLAATLIHEVNHVLNRSELNYYQSDDLAFMEEYRAFYVEKLFREENMDDEKALKALQLRVKNDYNLDVDINKFPLIPTGLLYPTASNWPIHWPQQGQSYD